MKDKHNIDWDEDYSPRNIASTTDCTGMMYKPPVTDDETENYEDIYSVPQQTNSAAQKGVETARGRIQPGPAGRNHK